MNTPLIIVLRGGRIFGRIQKALDAGALREGAEVLLEREPENPYDNWAIKTSVIAAEPDGDSAYDIGYVAREMAAVIAPTMDEGQKYKCKVLNWTDSSVNAQLDKDDLTDAVELGEESDDDNNC